MGGGGNVSDDKDLILSQKFTSCVRVLSAESVEKAKSGHPGLCLGAADVLYVLWQKFLKFNPSDPGWINRDRFILSAGHGSMLLYSMLHLYGYDLTLEDLKNFRQLKSKTPGHPELGVTPGVETSTGPLGQGFANAVGMAIAAEMLATKLSKDGFSPMDHKTYVFCGDGDIMEGIVSEAASMAGHLKLSNLVAIYDDNRITIEGNTDLAFSENVEQKFMSLGWDVIKIDGHNYGEIVGALKVAGGKNGKPLMIIARTTIAKGSVNFEGSNKSHGAPLGEAEVREIKKKHGYDEAQSFCVPPEVKQHASERVAELAAEYSRWNKDFAAFLSKNPDVAAEYEKFNAPAALTAEEVESLSFQGAQMATRAASGQVMQYIAKKIPGFVGGSADLAPSTNTYLKDFTSFSGDNRTGRNLHFGIREHSMAAIINGIALYGNFIPFGSTFLIFSDYMKPSVRLSAMMKLHVVYVLTHDSFFVGEDGPTHQPVEQVWGLRFTPGLDVIRPCDAKETAYAWVHAVNTATNPTALVLTRQNVPHIDRVKYAGAEGLLKGGYVISPEPVKGRLDIIIIATGSEVYPVLRVQEKLSSDGISARVVSMPCLELFERQEKSYRESVIDPACRKRVVVEAGISGGWHRYVGLDGLVIGIERFGTSAPAGVLCEEYGFTPEKLYGRIRGWYKS